MSAADGSYRLIDHTGDLALLVRAPTLHDLYDVCTRALFDVILDVRTVEARQSHPIRIDGAADAEDLLVRYLSELVFLHDSRGWLFRGARVDVIERDHLEAEAAGEMFDPARHRIERQVKAVTYHHLLLAEDRDGWTSRLVLDL
jgi:SHS2 domain-containing protein